MKALAIVKLPDCCYHCKFNIIDGDVHDCYICHKKFERDNQMIRQEWCPLKPMPEKKKTLDALDDIYAGSGFERGYNACIDEILGEEE